MEVRFDSFNRFETPNFTLCSPGSEYEDGKLTNVIGSLYLTSDEEIVANFNEMSELNLVVYQDPEDAPVAIYDHVKNRSNIFVDGIGFFNITSVDETIENGMKYKNVRANSCEAEIENRIMPVEFYSQESEVDYSYNVTFQFTTLLEMLVANLPLWQIGTVDPELEDLYRTFEDVSEETNILSFMITDMQDAYECIFSFDTIHRLINVYSQNNYVRETSIHLSNSDIVNSINITENSDDIYTAISVFGEDELTITAVNPTGSSIIYKFDYYLDVMPAALRTKVVAWQNRVDEVSSTYFTYSAGYYNYLSEKNILVYDLDAINTQIEMYQKLRDNIVASSNYANATLLAYVTKSALTHSVMNIVDEFNKSGVTYKIAPYYADSVEVASNKATIAYVPTGNVGSQIKAVYVKDNDGIYTTKLTQSTSVSNTTFTYSNKVLTFKSGLLANGTEIDVFYHTSDSSVVEDAVIITDVISDIDRELTSLRNQAIAKQTEIDEIDVNLERLKQSRERISDEVYINNYFTQEELELLSLYTYEGSYTDDYITITDRMTPQERLVQMKSLYDRAKLQLEKIAEPTAEFNVDTENFIFQSKFADWAEELETGCLINVELHPNDIAKLFLSSFTVNYQDASLSMRFGNRFNKYDAKSLFEKVLGNVNRTANSLQYVKETLYPIRSGEYNLIKEALENIRTLSAGQALAASNQDFIIDSTGITGKQSDGSGDYYPEQLKIVNNMIAMTDDAWETCKIAIGKILLGDNTYRYGINAEVLMGNIIMGNELHIMTTDEQGNPYELLSAVDNRISLSAQSTLSTAKTYTDSEITSTKSEIRTDYEDYADTVLSDFVNGEFAQTIGALQDQIDGNITTWFYDYAPTLSNIPASDWTTINERKMHLGDLFYDNSTGYCYRFQIKSTAADPAQPTMNDFEWREVSDSAIAAALRQASLAYDLADHKRRVFVERPTVPYDVGDLWSDGSDLWKCATAKTAEQSYAASDWVKATNYVDMGDVQTAVDALQSTLEEQIDAKIETYAQNENPSTAWTSAAVRNKHTGDLWYYTGTEDLTVGSVTIEPSKTYQYNGSTNTWSLYKSPTSSLFDFADSKSTVYYGSTSGSYDNLEADDLLVDSTTGIIYRWSGSAWVEQIASTTTNLLPAVYYSEYAHDGADYTLNGITWTLNKDGSITATGTATANSSYSICGSTLAQDVPVLLLDTDKKYRLHGCPSGGSSSKYRLMSRCTPEGTTPSSSSGTVKYDTGSGVTLVADTRYAYIYAIVYKNYVCPAEGITFYPMLEVGTVSHKYVSSHSSTYDVVGNLKTDLEAQIDAKIETFYSTEDPSDDWASADYSKHNGDIWHDSGNNRTYRWSQDGTSWGWQEIDGVPEELLDTIDGKSTIYYGNPSTVTTGINQGDYLVDETDGSTYRWNGSAWVKVTDYQTAIDDMQVGGRNLLYDTNAPTMSPTDGEGLRYFHNVTSFEANALGTEWCEISDPPVYGINYGAKHVCTETGGGIHEMTFYNGATSDVRAIMVPGETYTFSMWCKTSVANAIVQFTMTSLANNVEFKKGSAYRVTLQTANTWTKCVWTFKFLGGTSNPYIYAGYIYNLVGEVYCCGYKLELGDKATDWSDYYVQPDNRGGTNLIQNLKPIDLSSQENYPNINGYIPSGIRYAVANTEITNAINGITQTVTSTSSAMLLGINFGSDYSTETEDGAKTLYGLTTGTPYTFSYDCTAKLFSGTISVTTSYFVSTLLYIYNTNTSAWELYKTQYHIPFLVYNRGVTQSARCKFTFILPDYASSFYLRVGIPSITASHRTYFSYGDYISIENLMLEEGTLASRWQEASADILKRSRIERTADLQVLSESIIGTVGSTITNTANGIIEKIQSDYSTIEQTDEKISEKVTSLRNELFGGDEGEEGRITKLESELNQSVSDITATIKKNDEVLSYFSLQEDGFYIGSGTSTIKLRETATSIQFIETTTDKVLAEFNTAGLVSSRVDTEDQIAISEGGNDQWAIRKGTAVDGKNNLNIVWLGG